MDDPRDTLLPPVADPLIPPAVDVYLHIGDLVSLGHWAIVAIDKMGGPDLAEELGEWFAGDWSEVARSGDALDRLGDFCNAGAGGLRDELAALERDWSGRAATAAQEYFHDLAARLSTQATCFRDIAQQYRGTAFGVKEMALAVGGLVESLVDYAIAAGISLAAAAASSWTVVGGLAGGAAAGYSIVRGAQVIRQILEIRAKVWLACEALMGLIAGSLSSIEGFSSVSLRDHTEDRDLRRSVQRVLDGDAPLRELARSEAFGALVGPLAQRGWAHWASLDEDAQERLADQGGGPPR